MSTALLDSFLSRVARLATTAALKVVLVKVHFTHPAFVLMASDDTNGRQAGSEDFGEVYVETAVVGQNLKI